MSEEKLPITLWLYRLHPEMFDAYCKYLEGDEE